MEQRGFSVALTGSIRACVALSEQERKTEITVMTDDVFQKLNMAVSPKLLYN